MNLHFIRFKLCSIIMQVRYDPPPFKKTYSVNIIVKCYRDVSACSYLVFTRFCRLCRQKTQHYVTYLNLSLRGNTTVCFITRAKRKTNHNR